MANTFTCIRIHVVFSIGQSQVAGTIRYISRQREHHGKVSFADEFRKFVLVHDLPVDERYLLG